MAECKAVHFLTRRLFFLFKGGRAVIEALRLFLISCIFLFGIGGMLDNDTLMMASLFALAWVGLPMLFISTGWMEKRGGRFWIFFCVGILLAFWEANIFVFAFSTVAWIIIEAVYLLAKPAWPRVL